MSYSYACAWGCGATVETPRKVPGGSIGCGQGPCADKHNEAARQAIADSRARRAERARERRANPPQPVLGEWGMALMLANPGLRGKAARSR